ALLFVTTAHVEDGVRDARAALTEGREQLRDERPADAERSLLRGKERIAHLPGVAELQREFDDELERARRLRFTAELRAAADQMRFLTDPEGLRREVAGRLAIRCEQLWADRHASPEDRNEAVRADWLDLAVLGARCRVRAAPRDETGRARRQALTLLDAA